MPVRISLGQVKDGINEFDLLFNCSDIGLAESQVKDTVSAYVKVMKISNQLNLNVRLNGILNLDCDRCLDTFEKEFESSFELVYIVDSHAEKMKDDDYLRVYSPHMRYLDITKDVKDFIELAIPMRRVPEEKENGACSWCGKTQDYWKSFIADTQDEDI